MLPVVQRRRLDVHVSRDGTLRRWVRTSFCDVPLDESPQAAGRMVLVHERAAPHPPSATRPDTCVRQRWVTNRTALTLERSFTSRSLAHRQALTHGWLSQWLPRRDTRRYCWGCSCWSVRWS